MIWRLFRSWTVAAATLGVVGVLVCFVFAVWLGPRLIAREVLVDTNGTASEREKAVHDARIMIISLGGGIVVVTGLLYTARNYRLTHRGQITDRFANTLERLGSNELYIRIGGIHALEHVMRDSPDFSTDVVQVLVNFIRARSPRRVDEVINNENWMHPPGWIHEVDRPDEPPPDVQAALSVLGQRPARATYGGAPVDLRRLHLRGANLTDANLVGVYLEDADLAKCRLDSADLTGAVLRRVNLEGANLFDANLARAALDRAQLAFALLGGANLTEASLDRADLKGTHLGRAKLIGTDLDNACIMGAKLIKAELNGAYLDHANLAGLTLIAPISVRLTLRTRI